MKTRLTPTVQFDRTLGLAVDFFPKSHNYIHRSSEQIYGHLFFGRIVKPLRLFYVGDFVVMYFDNGQAERWRCTAVSSKGYRIVDHYVHFKAWRDTHARFRNGQFRVRRPVPKEHQKETPWRHADAVVVEQSGQPVKFLDVFRSWPVDPASQACVLERLRAGEAVSR